MKVFPVATNFKSSVNQTFNKTQFIRTGRITKEIGQETCVRFLTVYTGQKLVIVSSNLDI